MCLNARTAENFVTGTDSARGEGWGRPSKATIKAMTIPPRIHNQSRREFGVGAVSSWGVGWVEKAADMVYMLLASAQRGLCFLAKIESVKAGLPC